MSYSEAARPAQWQINILYASRWDWSIHTDYIISESLHKYIDHNSTYRRFYYALWWCIRSGNSAQRGDGNNFQRFHLAGHMILHQNTAINYLRQASIEFRIASFDRCWICWCAPMRNSPSPFSVSVAYMPLLLSERMSLVRLTEAGICRKT